MCCFPGCANPPKAGSAAWGIGVSVCNAHYTATRNYILRFRDAHNPAVPLGIDQEYLDDYVKLKLLMSYGTDKVEEILADLNTDLVAGAQWIANNHDPLDRRFKRHRNGSYSANIGRCLEAFEALCWFPGNRINFPGLLSADEFESAFTMGFQKDPGAGAVHGAYTHRFQWHAVMRVITQGFTTRRRAGWNKTPLDLYVSMGGAFAKRAGAWAAIFDHQRDDLPDFPRGYGNPDQLFAHIRGNGALTMLQPRAAARYQRQHNMEMAIQLHSMTRYNGMADRLKPVSPATGAPTPPGQVAIANHITKWRSLGQRPASLTRGWHVRRRYTEEEFAALVFDDMVNAGDLTANQLGGWRQEGNSVNILTSRSAAQPFRAIDSTLLRNSYAGLDTGNWRYTAQRGAFPLT